jgi:hypothetical protein
LFDLNTDQNVDALLLLTDGGGDGGSFRSFSAPTYRDLDRRKGIASDLDLRNAGSLSIRLETLPTAPTPSVEKRETEDDEEDEDDVVAALAQHAQGRALAHSGQSAESRSRRHTGHIPVRRRFVGCLRHFHTSSSST